MTSFLAIGVFLLVALLFYKFVDRKHKIILGQLGLGVLLIVAIASAASALMSQRAEKEAQRKQWDAMLAQVAQLSLASVAFVGDSSVTTLIPDSQCETYAPLTGKRCAKIATTTTTLIFQMCNRSREKTIRRVEFVPKTAERGHSKTYNVVTDLYSTAERRHVLDSDRILKPSECSTERWSGSYNLMDSTFAEVNAVETDQ